MHFPRLFATVGLALAAFATGAFAQEAAIREAIAKRVPQLKSIDEVRPAGIPGLYEVRANGVEIYYTDAKGNYLIQGNLYETKGLRNLTEERINKLTAIKFSSLPLKDAFTIVRGNGSRKLAVFEDPNCGYCKRFERDLQKIDNVTIYMFLYPILGPDSMTKSENIWCATDKGKTFTNWMTQNVVPPQASCDTAALQRNVAFGQQNRISGTPTTFFADGTRVAGAVPLRANAGVSSPGVKLHGAGFIVTHEEAASLGLGAIPGLETHIREYRNGRDLTAEPRDVLVIDLFGLTAEETQAMSQRFKQHNTQLLEDMYPHHKDRSKLIAVAKQGRQQRQPDLAQPQPEHDDAQGDGEKQGQ